MDPISCCLLQHAVGGFSSKPRFILSRHTQEMWCFHFIHLCSNYGYKVSGSGQHNNAEFEFFFCVHMVCVYQWTGGYSAEFYMELFSVVSHRES